MCIELIFMRVCLHDDQKTAPSESLLFLKYLSSKMRLFAKLHLLVHHMVVWQCS